MGKITRTVEVEGGEYRDRTSGEKVVAVCWLKDGDHPLVERYPIDRREFKGLLVLGPKDKHALRFGDWIVEDAEGRMFVVSGAPRKTERRVEVEGVPGAFRVVEEEEPSAFADRYLDAATWDKEQKTKAKTEAVAKVVMA